MIGRRGFLAALLVGPCVPAKPAGVDYKPPATGELVCDIGGRLLVGWTCVGGSQRDDGSWVARYVRSNTAWTDVAMPWAGMHPQEFRSFPGADGRMDVVWV